MNMYIHLYLSIHTHIYIYKMRNIHINIYTFTYKLIIELTVEKPLEFFSHFVSEAPAMFWKQIG